MPGSWVDERAQVLVGLLGERGLTMSLEASRVLVANQVEHVCQQVGLSERAARAYVTDDALGGLADSVACSLVEEFPGADLHTLPRTVGMPVAMAGLTLSALAETLLLYVDHGRADSIAEAPLRELTVMLSLLGLSLPKVTGRRSLCRRRSSCGRRASSILPRATRVQPRSSRQRCTAMRHACARWPPDRERVGRTSAAGRLGRRCSLLTR